MLGIGAVAQLPLAGFPGKYSGIPGFGGSLTPDPRFISVLASRTFDARLRLRQLISTLSFRKSISAVRERAPISAARLRRFVALMRIIPMPQAPDFSPMDVGETITGAIDFGAWLDAGVSIASVVSVSVANYLPASGAAFVTPSGSPQIGTVPVSDGGSGVANAAVLQKWVGANPGTARITITVTTSDGQTLIGWAHQPVGTPN